MGRIEKVKNISPLSDKTSATVTAPATADRSERHSASRPACGRFKTARLAELPAVRLPADGDFDGRRDLGWSEVGRVDYAIIKIGAVQDCGKLPISVEVPL
jgi:hypothetical protein